MARPNDRSLEAIRLLAVLPPEVRRELETMCQWRRFARGEQILGHQDQSTEVYLIVRGRVRVVIYSVAGRQIAFDDLGEGSHFGEIAAIDGGPRSASVVARSRVTMAVLSGSLFMHLCGRHPELALAVMRDLTGIVRRITQRVVTLSTLGAQNRVHAELLHLARERLNGVRTIVPLPQHADIAARVSTTRETVARVFADLARQRIIERRGDALVVRDLERLSAMVEEVRSL
jgi:CRP/FNR family cyclic AMP-dependent transcriptional regulator